MPRVALLCRCRINLVIRALGTSLRSFPTVLLLHGISRGKGWMIFILTWAMIQWSSATGRIRLKPLHKWRMFLQPVSLPLVKSIADLRNHCQYKFNWQRQTHGCLCKHFHFTSVVSKQIDMLREFQDRLCTKIWRENQMDRFTALDGISTHNQPRLQVLLDFQYTSAIKKAKKPVGTRLYPSTS